MSGTEPRPAPHPEITSRVIGAGIQVHRAMGPGFLESVYQNALVHELRLGRIGVEVGPRIQVMYRGRVVGEFVADILVEGLVIVEVKAVRKLTVAHQLQLVNYLTATGVEVGLLMNFGAPRLEFRRKLRVLGGGERT